MAGYALPTTGFSDGPDDAPPSTIGEVWDTAFKAQRDIANPLARQNILDEEYQKRIDQVEQATGVRLFHPRRDMPTPDDYRELREDPEAWRGSTSYGAAVAVAERRFHRELAKLGEQHPDKLDKISPHVTVWDTAYARVRKAEADSEAAVRRSPLSVDLPLLGPVDPVALGASFFGWAHDPVNVGVALASGFAGSAAKSILWNAARQAAAGALQQAAVEPFAQAWRAEAGLDFGWQQAAQNVAFAGAFGGGLDAAGRSLNRAVRGKPLSGTAEPLKTPANDVSPPLPATEAAPPAASAGDAVSTRPDAQWASEGRTQSARDPDTALEAAARRLPEDHPVRRAAEGDADATIAVAERLGPLADDPAAVRGALDQFKFETLQEAAIAEALAGADADAGMAARLRADLEDRLGDHVAHVAEPDANPPAGAASVDFGGFDTTTKWLHGSAAKFDRFDVSRGFPWLTLNREAASAFGDPMEFHVRTRKLGTMRDFLNARIEAGKSFEVGTPAWNRAVLDILKRDGFDAIRDDAFKGAGGVGREVMMVVDPDNIRPVRDFADGRIAALREGELAPLEAAALIRERPELAAEVPPTTDLARGIHALTRLSDEGFARVTAGEIVPELAAIVADAAPPAMHADLLDRLARLAPRDTATARGHVAEMLQRPLDTDTANVLLQGADRIDAPDAPWASEGARTKAPEFDEPVGEGAKLQAESLQGLADKAASIDDVKAKLRLFRSQQPLEKFRGEGVQSMADLPGRFSWKEPPKAGAFQMFHATNRDFARFDMTRSQDFGVHFGTAEQAARRIEQTGRTEASRTIPVEVDVKNAIALADPGYWGPREVAGLLQEKGLDVTPEEMRRFNALGVAIDRAEASGATTQGALRRAVVEANQAIRDKLDALGIDGIWYRNTVEASGWSLLVWKEGQVKSAITGERMMRLRDGGSLAGTAYAPELLARETAIGAELAEAAQRTLPRGVALELAERLRVGAYELDGYFDRKSNLLAVALDAADPAFTFSHERIHALKAHGLFTDAEWRLLVSEAGKAGMRQEMGLDAVQAYRQQLMPAMVKEQLARAGVTDAAGVPWAELEPMLRQAKLIDGDDVRASLERRGLWDEARLQDMIDEEAVAFLAERWRAGEALPKGVAGLMERVMAFLERVRNVLAGHGFNTLDDVFRRIDTGEVALRTPREVTLPGGAKVTGVPLFAIRAFHGSPHDFDRFSLDKIGTGEGAQAYGHGLYFAESEGVARSYRDKLTTDLKIGGKPFDERDPSHVAAYAVFVNRGDRAAAAKGISDQIGWMRQSETATVRYQEAARLARDLGWTPPEVQGGRVYEVSIKAEREDFLDWDMPLSQQGEMGRKAIAALPGSRMATAEPTAEHYVDAFGGERVSKHWREAGIPGIKYLDQGSRASGDGTYNFVVFDDSLIEIVAKDGEPVGPPSWVRDIGAALEAATADADAGSLVTACKLF